METAKAAAYSRRPMVKIRTPDEIRRTFETQIAMLRSSCEAYDRGVLWEAQRIATTIFVLMHDGGKRNLSLLTHMGERSRLQYISTAYEDGPTNVLPWHPLVSLKFGTEIETEYSPCLDFCPPGFRRISADKWWKRDVIFHEGGLPSKGRLQLTRVSLVFALRNKEGGAHYDSTIENEAYVSISEKPVWTFMDSTGVRKPLLNLGSTCMRQIAYELLETLKGGGLIA
jgi:hypothetical protein